MSHFLLSSDPAESAAWHADHHAGKMALEGAQLLSAAHPAGAAPYRLTHANHPCAVWTRASAANYRQLVERCRALLAETSRRGKGHSPSVSAAIEWLAANEPRLPDVGPTPFTLAMPILYQGPDPFAAYRSYYLADKQGVLAQVQDQERRQAAMGPGPLDRARPAAVVVLGADPDLPDTSPDGQAESVGPRPSRRAMRDSLAVRCRPAAASRLIARSSRP